MKALESKSNCKRPHIRPRKPIEYDNEVHGRNDSEDGEDAGWSAEDAQDSWTILLRDGDKAVPVSQDAWHECAAAAKLASLPKSGLWIPIWLALATRHPARARLLSWLLHLFEDSNATDSEGNPMPRARAKDETGATWWTTSRRRIAEETLLDQFSADRARKWLSDHAMIEVVVEASALRLRPNGKSLINAYLKITGDDQVEDEAKQMPEGQQWLGSITRQKASDNSIGTFVHDALMIICDRKPGPAAVLAHILYWHGLGKKLRTRARIVRRGRLWIARSLRQLQGNPGGDPGALAGYVRWLVERGFIDAEFNRWTYKNERDRGRPTLHLRPCPGAIGAQLTNRWDEIVRAIELKQSFQHKQEV